MSKKADSLVISELKFTDFKFEEKQISRDEFENSEFEGSVDFADDHNMAIGKFLTKFSVLDGGITQWNIPQIIGLRFDEQGFNYKIGHSIVAKMGTIEKFNLFVDLLISEEVDGLFNENMFQITKSQLHYLRKMLIRAAEARNIIAHADWTEGTGGGWYVTKYVQNRNTGSYDYLLHKLTAADIRSAIEYLELVIDEMYYVVQFIDFGRRHRRHKGG